MKTNESDGERGACQGFEWKFTIPLGNDFFRVGDLGENLSLHPPFLARHAAHQHLALALLLGALSEQPSGPLLCLPLSRHAHSAHRSSQLGPAHISCARNTLAMAQRRRPIVAAQENSADNDLLCLSHAGVGGGNPPVEAQADASTLAQSTCLGHAPAAGLGENEGLFSLSTDINSGALVRRVPRAAPSPLALKNAGAHLASFGLFRECSTGAAGGSASTVTLSGTCATPPS